jgi:hypothetical protein
MPTPTGEPELPSSRSRPPGPRVRIFLRELLTRFGRESSAFGYACFAAACVLLSARLFYSQALLQLFYSSVRPDAYLSASDWSAPLDDVFIHFDFARSIARGHPFEWSAGNGYSSGGTSLLYPFALAPGFFLGFDGLELVRYAAIVACTSVFATLLWARVLFRGLPRWTHYAAPPALLSVGALSWSLWSGMEVAFFLAIWALALLAWDELVNPPGGSEADASPLNAAIRLGLANGLLAATRPEAVLTAAVFGASGAWAVRERRGARFALGTFLVSVAFAAFVVVAQAVSNRLLTGDWSAAGALVKLEMYDPRLTRQEVLDAWLFHLRYQVSRVTGYHVADGLGWGSMLWGLSALPLVFRKTRRVGILLWSQALLWIAVVALNGQVRWQNERYTMPALAFLLLSGGVGVGAACSHEFGTRPRSRVFRLAAALSVAAVVGLLAIHQVPRLRDQVWFFGRAGRNIRDQHLKVGRRIRKELPEARRVLLGDAGAIPYASDLPALDIIGLGGYPGLPFARASRWGVAAIIELIERIPGPERPDVMAIYPGWWGDLPIWFGRALDGVSVRGNVICGGLTKMIYAANWEALEGTAVPITPPSEGHAMVDEMDFADVLSEREHAYRITGAPGFVAMKLLPRDAGDRERGLWDGGRVVPPGASVRFELSGLSPGVPAELVLRTAPSQSAKVVVRVGGAEIGSLSMKPTTAWYEVSISVPAERVRDRIEVELTVEQSELVLYHLWGIQRR